MMRESIGQKKCSRKKPSFVLLVLLPAMLVAVLASCDGGNGKGKGGSSRTWVDDLSTIYEFHEYPYTETNVTDTVAVSSKILEYNFKEGVGTSVKDVTGNGNDGTLHGSVKWLDGAIELDGNGTYVRMPHGILSTLSNITVVADVYVDASNVIPSWICSFGSAVFAADGEGYLSMFLRAGGSFRGTISTDWWQSEENTIKSAGLTTGEWKQVAYTIDGSTARLFENGSMVAENTAVTHKPSDLGNSKGNFIGRPAYAADNYFKGKVGKFRIYNSALTDVEIKELSDQGYAHDEITDSSVLLYFAAKGLSVPNADEIRGNISMPELVENNVKVAWTSSDESVISKYGVVTRGAVDKTVKLTAILGLDGVGVRKTFDVTVKKAVAGVSESDFYGYLFTYFVGQNNANEEQIYFALSTDGLHWTDLNGGNPVLKSSVGDTGVRDPYILRSPEGDKFFMIATDLQIFAMKDWGKSQTNGSQSIVVWESTDLVNWSEGRLVTVARSDAGCTWAPEIIYDDNTGDYMIYWASRIAADSYAKHRIYYTKTRDFHTFTDPEIFLERTNDVIDSTMIKHSGVYYRFSKDETNKNILIDYASRLLGIDYTNLSAPTVEAQTGVEGPAIFKFNGENKWCLLLDNYGGGGYYPLISTDISSGAFSVLSSTEYSMPSGGPRHGTVMSITEAEYNALQAKSW